MLIKIPKVNFTLHWSKKIGARSRQSKLKMRDNNGGSTIIGDVYVTIGAAKVAEYKPAMQSHGSTDMIRNATYSNARKKRVLISGSYDL